MGSETISYDEIATFFEDGWIDDVLFTVKSGKEATVHCCKASPGRGAELFALKIYKPLAHRSFRDDAVYREGRVIPDARVARAVANKSRKGRAFQFAGWLEHEYATLGRLASAGAAVPRPLAIGRTAMLIEWIGTEDGRPAPQLCSVRLAPAEAEVLLEEALRNIEVMLACNVVHGDLSAYNMLYAGERLRIIDLPQAVDARTNPSARDLLARDVANVCRYFASQGAEVEPGSFAGELWELYSQSKL